jgi:hypothetical protein
VTERPSVYVPTVRSGDAVRDELDDVVPHAEYTVRDVDFDAPVRDAPTRSNSSSERRTSSSTPSRRWRTAVATAT